MDADLQAQNDLDSLLSRLGDQVHDCRARVKDNTLKLGSSGNQILKGLRLYTDSVGALTIALGCPECQFVGYEASGVCQLCGGWGETRLTVDLVADTLQDEVQLAAKYLLVLLMERGQMDYMRHDFPRPPTLNTMDRHLEECVAVDRPDEGHSPPRWLDEQGEHDVELWEGLLQREDGQNTEQSRNHELQEPHHQLEELCASQDSDNLDDEDDEADEEDEVSEDYYYDFYESPSDVAVDLKSLSRYGPEDLVKLKTAMLAPNLLRRVRKVTKLQCEHDPDWVLQLLYDASQHLEELQLHTPARSHVEVMESMPRLMRLDIEYFASEARSSEDFIFRKPPARHRGLRWLRVKGLSMRSTFSLLRAHRRTLEEMWVAVGSWRKTADDEDVKSSCAPSFSDEGWPTSCRDLDQRLSRVGQVPQLQRLVLYRWFNAHDPITCMRQIAAVRNVLPGVNVQCFECDGLTMQKL